MKSMKTTPARVYLKRARKIAGLTQCDVAREMDISQSFVSRIEKGTVAMPPDFIERYARAVESLTGLTE